MKMDGPRLRQVDAQMAFSDKLLVTSRQTSFKPGLEPAHTSLSLSPKTFDKQRTVLPERVDRGHFSERAELKQCPSPLLHWGPTVNPRPRLPSCALCFLSGPQGLVFFMGPNTHQT